MQGSGDPTFDPPQILRLGATSRDKGGVWALPARGRPWRPQGVGVGIAKTGSLHVGSPLGTASADSRFATRTGGYTVLYAFPDSCTAFIETIVRDRFAHGRTRKVALREITGRAWVRMSSEGNTPLTLLDLRADGCTRIGASTDVVKTRNLPAGRAFGKAIHAEQPDVDGLVYASRLTGEDVYAIYNEKAVFGPRLSREPFGLDAGVRSCQRDELAGGGPRFKER